MDFRFPSHLCNHHRGTKTQRNFSYVLSCSLWLRDALWFQRFDAYIVRKNPAQRQYVRSTSLADDAFHRRTGRRIELLGHAAGYICLAPGDHRMFHGFGHQDRIMGIGDASIHQHRISA